VDCFVTTNAYPFGTTSNTGVLWSGNGAKFYSGASGQGSDKNGRTNTAAISSKDITAVQICKNLGAGWYLPSYEELYAMSSGSANASSNNRNGVGILQSGWHWSSTEYYRNGGRRTTTNMGDQAKALIVNSNSYMDYDGKLVKHYVRCAWRL
jgi:hypothetical protein